jgi:hypothetical protein
LPKECLDVGTFDTEQEKRASCERLESASALTRVAGPINQPRRRHLALPSRSKLALFFCSVSTFLMSDGQTIQDDFKMELDRNMTISDLQTAGAFGKQASTQLESALTAATRVEMARINAALAKLSPGDQNLARAQVFCAIDQDSRLGSMGPIQKIMVKNQPVFLCCKGCEAETKAHPDETLVKVQNLKDRSASGAQPQIGAHLGLRSVAKCVALHDSLHPLHPPIATNFSVPGNAS